MHNKIAPLLKKEGWQPQADGVVFCPERFSSVAVNNYANPFDFKTSMGFEIGSVSLSSFADFPMLNPISCVK